MIVPSYENFRVLASIRRYGATPDRGKDGRFVFPDVVLFAPVDFKLARNGQNQPINSAAANRYWPWIFTANGFTFDPGGYGAQQWDWFLWHEAGHLRLERNASLEVSGSYSGSVILNITNAGAAAIGVAPASGYDLTPTQVGKLVRSSYVYTQERATGDVYVFNLEEIAAGNAPSTILAPPS